VHSCCVVTESVAFPPPAPMDCVESATEGWHLSGVGPVLVRDDVAHMAAAITAAQRPSRRTTCGTLPNGITGNPPISRLTIGSAWSDTCALPVTTFVRILNCDSSGLLTRRNARLLQQFRGQLLDENASELVPESPQKNDDHVVETALRRGSPRETATQLRSSRQKTSLAATLDEPNQKVLWRRKRKEPPVANRQLARRELVHDDAFAGEARRILLQQRPRRERAVPVLDEAVDGPLQDVTQMLDESRGSARADRLRRINVAEAVAEHQHVSVSRRSPGGSIPV